MTSDIILRQLVLGLQRIYGDLLDSIILYGSTACGTHTDDSDVDVAILLHPGATKEMREQRLELLVDLELACGKVLSALCNVCLLPLKKLLKTNRCVSLSVSASV